MLVFSRNIFFGAGGAEKSIHGEILSDRSGKKFTLCGANVPPAYAKNVAQIDYGQDVAKVVLPKTQSFPVFYFYEYLLNKKSVSKFIQNINQDYDELWAQNLWAPLAINSFEGDVTYFARDEYFYNYFATYQVGKKRYLKKVRALAERPGISAYIFDNSMAVQKSTTIVANSNFMAHRIWEVFGRDAVVRYPLIDAAGLKKRYLNAVAKSDALGKGVVMLGDSISKGVETFFRLANDYPHVKFILFGRKCSQEYIVKNVHYMPWVDDVALAYALAKVVIVPSVWEEAFGRVAAECEAISIPCVVSNVGGLPEAVSHKSDQIAKNYPDFKLKVGRYV
ncbi:glycosyltransferase [Teredinibacter turnerae]|uniref:glycosyltransferase n=1 Tax=Teredinibacter turnerae TaxID=2426 RepID=UPI001E53C91F|nr:glycosyltransferase [Teredinibacter turnerae]